MGEIKRPSQGTIDYLGGEWEKRMDEKIKNTNFEPVYIKNMKNTEIKYNTSTNYENLYQLLKAEIIVIGFIAIEIDGIVNTEYSKLIEMTYSKEYEKFDLGNTILFECDFDKDRFIKFCEKQYVRFIPLSHKKVKCVDDRINGLTKDKIYQVLSEEEYGGDLYKIIDDNNDIKRYSVEFFDKPKPIKIENICPITKSKEKEKNSDTCPTCHSKTDICPVCFSNDVTDISEYRSNGVLGPGYYRWKITDERCCNKCGVVFKPLN